MSDLARTLIVLGAALVILGGVLLLASRYLPWLGNLPGDLRYEGDDFKLFVPLGTMILVSIVGTILLNILIRIFRQ